MLTETELMMLRGGVGICGGYRMGFGRDGEWYYRKIERRARPPTPAELTAQERFRTACAAWKALADDEKRIYMRRHAPNGYQLFLRLYFRQPEERDREIEYLRRRAAESALPREKPSLRKPTALVRLPTPKPRPPAAPSKQTPPARERSLWGSHCATPCSSVAITPLPHCMASLTELHEVRSCW